MILVVNSIKELDFSKLTELYIEDIEKDRHLYYRSMDPYEGRLCAENDLFHYLKEVFFGQSKGTYYIYMHQGRYISALRFEPYREGILVNAVVTDEQFRGKGHASSLFEKLIDSTVGPIYAHVHCRNQISIGLHRKFGFKKLADHAVLLNGTVCTDHITYIRNG